MPNFEPLVGGGGGRRNQKTRKKKKKKKKKRLVTTLMGYCKQNSVEGLGAQSPDADDTLL